MSVGFIQHFLPWNPSAAASNQVTLPQFILRSSKKTECLLRTVRHILVNTIFSAVLVAPLVVDYWRGTWFLLDTFLYPEDFVISCWIWFLLGFAILLLATWFQCWLQDFVTKRGPCLFFILSRLYTIILCLGKLLKTHSN